jgi:hypothetical protein
LRAWLVGTFFALFAELRTLGPSRREVLIIRSTIAALALILCANILGFVVLAICCARLHY